MLCVPIGRDLENFAAVIADRAASRCCSTLQIAEFEALLQNQQRSHGLGNFTGGILDRSKDSVEFLWRSEHGKVIKMLMGKQNFAGKEIRLEKGIEWGQKWGY